MGDLSCGLRKRTPSSVTCASWRRETIWKLRGWSALLVLLGSGMGIAWVLVCKNLPSAIYSHVSLLLFGTL
jgi:hypothetical protein